MRRTSAVNVGEHCMRLHVHTATLEQRRLQVYAVYLRCMLSGASLVLRQMR